MAFGKTSTHAVGQPRATQPVSAAPAKVKQSRPRRGKVAAHWEAWKIHEQTLGLTPSQARFADVFFHGDNCLLTGEAGSGKSHVVRNLLSFLRAQGLNVAITGSTGVASFNIGGQTIHSFAGLGIGEESTEQIVAKVLKNRRVKERLRATDVMFLDEVSMIKGDLLDKLDGVMKSVRHCYDPFGGVQMVFVGDYLQLPPVFRGSETQQFAFEADSWLAADIQTVLLKEQMRQKGDAPFLKLLNELRVGNASNLHVLDARIGATFPDDGIEAVRLFCKNVDVDAYNRERLVRLTTPGKTYRARDSGLPQHTEQFNKNCPAPEVLDLKIGAVVTLLTNEDVKKGFVNGSVGVVKAFTPEGVKVQFTTGEAVVGHNEWQLKEQDVGLDGKMKHKVVATRSQIPLKLAWAASVHRSQGQTLDRAIVDLSEAFGYAMVYVALSRVRDLASLSIVGKIPQSAVKVSRDCVEFYKQIG